MDREDPAPGAAPLRVVGETDAALSFPGLLQPEWAERWPWLAQGISWPGPDRVFDLGLSGREPAGEVLGRWRQLRQALGFPAAVHARQVHGGRVLWHDRRHDGFLLAGPADGHGTRVDGLLLTVSVADCVPIFVVAPSARAIALLHAGWRGIAAGVLEAGLAALARNAGVGVADLHVHLGPAVCGECYEVGPEVHAALGLAIPDGPRTVDLRRVIAVRAREAGVEPDSTTVSTGCTRCRRDRFFSHRAGEPGRQAAWLGLRAP